MPAGVTWGVYLKFATAAMLSMLAGSQVVHMLYRPLDNMEELVNEEVKRLQMELVTAIEKGEVQIKGQVPKTS